MAVKKILQLGDPRLNEISEELEIHETVLKNETFLDLKDTMLEFRRIYNCGRAIAAPQIGVQKRMIYMNIEGKETCFINPEITHKSEEMFELWDDCMSFPDLLVKVKRHNNIKVKYFDENFIENFTEFDSGLSELFQHEYDHLDGILATMKAIDENSIKKK